MTYDEAMQLITDRQRLHPHERFGQAAFNALFAVFPEEVDQLRGTRFDPFHRDERVAAFLEELGIQQ